MCANRERLRLEQNSKASSKNKDQNSEEEGFDIKKVEEDFESIPRADTKITTGLWSEVRAHVTSPYSSLIKAKAWIRQLV